MALGIFIMSHPRFTYNTKADLDELAYQKKKLLCQRAFTQLLSVSRGDVKAFKAALRTSGFLDKDIEMFNSILDGYVIPTFEMLCTGFGIDPASGVLAAKPVADEPATAAADESEDEGSWLEDDEDFFPGASGKGKVRAKNPYEVELAIADAIKDW